MRFDFRTTLMIGFAVVMAGASPAFAQSGSWGDVAVSAVMVNYDLSGTGNTSGLAVRTSRWLTSSVSLEFGGLFATPRQQFGSSTLFMPEAQLRYNWRAGRVAPYVGGGIGTALVKSSFHTDWDPTLSVAGGAGVRLTDRLGLRGEFRLRGHEWQFVGTTTELSAGLVWQIPGS